MTERSRWSLADIPWRDLRRERVAGSEELFYLVAGASLIEITTDLYTRNLVEHFAGDGEICAWLSGRWEPEELQHGRALREYVRRAWPEFDWERVYAAFRAEYGACCKPELLLPLRSLEMASRCVVEMSTSSYYTALNGAAGEPVLECLTRHIYQDEIGHYKYFYSYFRRYREREQVSRARVAGALWHRLKMISDEDSYIALKHLYLARHPGCGYDRRIYRDVVRRCRQRVARHFVHERAVRMLLAPLELAPALERMVRPFAERVARALV